MIETVFAPIHQSLGARMIDFAGFYMPVEFSGVTDEHLCVRQFVGVFDVSHMGEIWVKGPNALAFLQYVTSNDVSKLQPGKIQYSCFINHNGGIVDDLLVYCYEDQKYLLVVNASNIEKDWNWLNQNNTLGAELENSSDRISQLAVQGPKALDTLQKITDINLSTIPYYTFVVGTIGGIDSVIISNTGYTGAEGFELYFYNEQAFSIWQKVFDAGLEFGIKPAGLAARDTLRLEMGYCLYGNDLNDTTTPLEAGLGWITKWVDGKNFIGRAVLEEQKRDGINRKLTGFVMQERAIPRQHYTIVDVDNNIIGEVTSGTMSPILKQGIGMGYINVANSTEGSTIFVSIRDKRIPAKVVRLPFISK